MRLEERPLTELQYSVEALQSSYVECIDDDRLEEWPEHFTNACVYKILPRENADRGLPLATIFCDSKGMLVDRIVSLRNANIYAVHYYRHMLSNVRIKAVENGVISVQSNYVVLQTRQDGATMIFSAGKYLDKIVEDAGVLKFREKIAVADTYRVDTLIVRPI